MSNDIDFKKKPMTLAVMKFIFAFLLSALLTYLLFSKEITNLQKIYFEQKVESQALASYMNKRFTMTPADDEDRTLSTLTALKYPADANGGVLICFNDDCFFMNDRGFPLKYMDAKYDEANKKWHVLISHDDALSHPLVQIQGIYRVVDSARAKKDAKKAHESDFMIKTGNLLIPYGWNELKAIRLDN